MSKKMVPMYPILGKNLTAKEIEHEIFICNNNPDLPAELKEKVEKSLRDVQFAAYSFVTHYTFEGGEKKLNRQIVYCKLSQMNQVLTDNLRMFKNEDQILFFDKKERLAQPVVYPMKEEE